MLKYYKPILLRQLKQFKRMKNKHGKGVVMQFSNIMVILLGNLLCIIRDVHIC